MICFIRKFITRRFDALAAQGLLPRLVLPRFASAPPSTFKHLQAPSITILFNGKSHFTYHLADVARIQVPHLRKCEQIKRPNLVFNMRVQASAGECRRVQASSRAGE